jgi:hypothetical protein
LWSWNLEVAFRGGAFVSGTRLYFLLAHHTNNSLLAIIFLLFSQHQLIMPTTEMKKKCWLESLSFSEAWHMIEEWAGRAFESENQYDRFVALHTNNFEIAVIFQLFHDLQSMLRHVAERSCSQDFS